MSMDLKPQTPGNSPPPKPWERAGATSSPMYGNSMYRGGYGSSYGGGMYNGGFGGLMGGYGMGMGGSYGVQVPNNPYGDASPPPGFWISVLRVVRRMI